jgi:hypothetical protein
LSMEATVFDKSTDSCWFWASPSLRTVIISRFQPYWLRIGPRTSLTSLAGLALTPIDFLDGSSSLKRTRGSTRTSVQPSVELSSERSRGFSALSVAKTSKEVNFRARFSKSRATMARMVSPFRVWTTVVACNKVIVGFKGVYFSRLTNP